MKLFRPGLIAFSLLVALYVWGGSSRAVTFAATWWLDHPPRASLVLATSLLIVGALLTLLGLGLALRAGRSTGENALWARSALGFHAVILLAIALALVMGWWEARWLASEETFGVRP